MAKFIATIKAIITRLVFAAHGFVAIWQVTIFKKNSFYWYLSSPILLLFFEGIFTLTIKENQEWKWFCPSVFLYLASIVPAIWLLELDKVDRRLMVKENFNLTTVTGANIKELNNLIGVQIKLPEISLSTETWITLIEQFLMLILIIGRWMLPKGDLTRDQLSQLLLVYIGTAADIIEFFDSFKDDKIAAEPLLVLLTLAIWSWSLMQFTVVLTATKSRKSRLSSTGGIVRGSNSCCSIDVWGIALNIALQDAPFLVFRLLIITHFNIISYMNVFFTCKNTLVILLQLYRLYVVYSEGHKQRKKNDFELTNISIISKPNMYGDRKKSPGRKKEKRMEKKVEKRRHQTESECSEDDDFSESELRNKKMRKLQNSRKDTGYSTGSSHTSTRNNIERARAKKQQHIKDAKIKETPKERAPKVPESKTKRLKRTDQDTKGRRKLEIDNAFSEESVSDFTSISEYENEMAVKKSTASKGTRNRDAKKYEKETAVVVTTTSDASSE